MTDVELVDEGFYDYLMELKLDPPHSDVHYEYEDRPDNLLIKKRKIMIDSRNIDASVRSLILDKYVIPVNEQMKSFMEGFSTLIPHKLVKHFKPNELELLICGVPVIDVKQWKKHTLAIAANSDKKWLKYEYKWFWEVIESAFSHVERAKLLYFITGSSRLPKNGFLSNVHFMEIYFDKELPKNVTPKICRRTKVLSLPQYSNKEILKSKLQMVIENFF